MDDERPAITTPPSSLDLDLSRRSRGEHMERMPLADYPSPEIQALTLWQKIGLIGTLLPHLFTFMYGVAVRNWRTTIVAILGAVAAILAHFNIVIPESWFEPIISIALLILGFFVKDAQVTGLPNDSNALGRR